VGRDGPREGPEGGSNEGPEGGPGSGPEGGRGGGAVAVVWSESGAGDAPRAPGGEGGTGGALQDEGGGGRRGRRRRGREWRPTGAAPEGQPPASDGAPAARGARHKYGKFRDRPRVEGGPGGAPKVVATDDHEGVEGAGDDADSGSDQAVGGDSNRGTAEGLLVIDTGGHGKLRRIERMWLPDAKNDVHVAPRLIQKFALREGSILRGPYGPGFGKHRFDLIDVDEVDGRNPQEVRSLVPFKALTSIDPDFQYELGDFTKDVALRLVDIICPIGRGQRGLIVAPPRTGKTILLQKIAKGISEHYPDVRLMVLLVDERPEEATEWQRATKGQVFVSTNDEPPKNHVELAESVWVRCKRLVELGEDVILLLDSITRLARAYNHVHGTSGKTMSGGIDAKTMERPKQFFGSARNTETAGSLTILGTTLIETGSKMDQVIFEEFKGTGNMELVLSRKLAERRIFPALDLERSGTRKEEKLLSSTRLKRINTLRRVLMRMHFADALDLLITKLEAVERNDDFLKRFEVDPEA